MSDRERQNFLHGAVTRAPGKRQIKPTNLATDALVIHDSEDESDEDFVGEQASNSSDEGGSDESSEEEEEEESDQASPSEDGIHIIESTNSRTGRPDPLICSICLNTRNVEGDKVIQCDKCGVAVHEGCYGVPDMTDDQASVVSNFSTEPWFCEPCLFELEKPPHCELCPSQFGAFKRADVGGKWIHLTCALFTPGISFGDIENFSAISWQEIDYKRFGRKPCDGCSNVLEARTGITTPCEAGFCKHNYHISCAQRLGLLIDAESENLPEHSSKHIDPHFILCRTHNFQELIAVKKQNYAIFIRQEQKRFVVFNRRLLDQRETFKLSKQRKQYDGRIRSFQDSTIHLPSIKNKRPRLVQSSSDFLEAFIEKAELFGVSPQEFTDSFTRLPPSQISYLPPSFSTEFVKYFEYRENSVFAEENKRLKDAHCELRLVEQAEKDLKFMLEKMSSRSPEKSTKKAFLEQKFSDLCTKLDITIEQEGVETADKSDESPKPKRQKVDDSPSIKRQRIPSNALKESEQKSSSKPHPSNSTAKIRPLLKNGNWRRRVRTSGSVDSNLDSEEDEDSSPTVPSSEGSSPPCLKNAEEDVESVSSEQRFLDDERPLLLPMISSQESVKKRITSRTSASQRKRGKH